MKDMFDCLEVGFNKDLEYVFLVKQRRNKRQQTNQLLYLSEVGINGSLVFRKGLENAKLIIPDDYFYEHIKLEVRTKGIRCNLIRMTKLRYYTTLKINPSEEKPVRKVKWWDRIKVWFSRKVIEFMTLPVDSSLPGED